MIQITDLLIMELKIKGKRDEGYEEYKKLELKRQ